MTRSTPSNSDSGNIMPASMTIMSSPSRSAIMFMPNSPRPPRGMAVRDCEVLLNDASAPGRKRESYHRILGSHVSFKMPREVQNAGGSAVRAAKSMRDAHENDRSQRSCRQRVQKAAPENSKLCKNPATQAGLVPQKACGMQKGAHPLSDAGLLLRHAVQRAESED